MTIKIIHGDCRQVLRGMEDNSVHCVVTSPPYWGLRDYGVDGQLGMERSLGEHVETMVEVFGEVRRVLRPDGTLWLNYGDSYATSPNGRAAAEVKALGNDDRTFRDKPFSTIGPIFVADHEKSDRRGQDTNRQHTSQGTNTQGRIVAAGILKPKDLCGIPWRVALALQADGWYLRQDIIWAKPNPMPESVRDRCTKAHEYIFLMAKSERYYYDGDAISEPVERIAATERGCPRDGVASGVPWEGSRRNKRSVWTITTEPFPEAHFATFPPALIEPCILAGCPEGGTVLDPFGGAGTTGLVADRLKRNAVLIELNPDYVVMADRRISSDAGMFADVTSVQEP